MTLNFKDASDFSGRTVNQNLYNQVVNMDNLAGPKDINVAWHFNAFNKIASGAECWYWLGDPIGYAIAKKLSAAMAKALDIPDRGPKATTNLYVISNSVGVTILPEVAFIDNYNDMQKYQKNKEKLFKACMDVFLSFPEYNFKSSHGGHYGFNMMDPGAVGNGFKEAVLAQEINKYMLKNKNTGGATVAKKVIYQTTPGKYRALKTDNLYLEKELKTKSAWKIKEGQEWYLEDVVMVGKYSRAKIRLNNDIRYCTMRDDYWKLISKTKAKKIK